MKNNYDNKQNFISRELSWLEFNQRVLEEAQDLSNPLFERLKFTSIVSSNLDEFFMVRVASLVELADAGINKEDPSGLSPEKQLSKISLRVHNQVNDQFNTFNKSIKKALKKENIYFLKPKDLDSFQSDFIENFYINNIYPVLTPMVVDQGNPFPLILNKTLNIALLLKSKEKNDNVIFGTVQVPSVLSRFIELPYNNIGRCFILLEDIIRMYLDSLFSGHKILSSSCYRITRNADLNFDEEEADDLLESIKQSIKQRKWGSTVRLEIESDVSSNLINILKDELDITKDEVYKINGPLDLTFLMKLSILSGFEHLKFKPMTGQNPIQLINNENIFEVISKEDILLHHPYNTFNPVVQLVQKAAVDPYVLAIKQTLYRVSGNSPIIEALAKAAEKGKQVTVLVELKARFDEANNIIWAKRLEKAGCHVIYGLVGLKTHCKLLLIVRKEADGIKRYVHMGTGNYNDVTANLYSDFGFFTSKPHYGADASALFNMLSGHSEPQDLYKLSYAPVGLRKKFLYLIQRETEHARSGKKACITAKLNSLVDKEIIESLYEASCAGVKINLIVRGICCLKPLVPGVSENITVRSIVGRFLEHSRAYYFYNDGEESLYLSSADWMTRNLDRRVEILFPVEDENVLAKVKEILAITLEDTVKARILNSDGTYSRINKRGRKILNSQEYFYEMILKENESYKFKQKESNVKSFRPISAYKKAVNNIV